MNEEQLTTITSQLADIEMPAEPTWWPVYAGIAFLLLITLTALQLMRRKHHPIHTDSSINNALVKLDELEDAWRQGALDKQTLGFRLATTLRLGLKLNRLPPTPPDQISADTEQWKQLHKTLHELRYSKQSELDFNTEIFNQIRHLIRLNEPGIC